MSVPNLLAAYLDEDGRKTHRPDWHTYFLLIADAVALRGDCRRRSVGAIIVGADKRIVSTGYNGGPPKGGSCIGGDCPRGLLTYEQLAEMSSYDTGPGACFAVHAEQNAIIHADWARCQGAILYTSQPPCDGCQKMIKGAGLEWCYRGVDGLPTLSAHTTQVVTPKPS